jgi:ankyrin repeat protein
MPINTTECQSYLNIIDELLSSASGFYESNPEDEDYTRHALALFESKLTLKELQAALIRHQDSQSNTDELKTVLANRWERIRGSFCDYTLAPAEAVNQLCFQLAAEHLYPLPLDPAQWDDLPPRTGPYFLLMPSLTTHQSVYGENIHKIPLHQCIMSDDGTRLIPINNCLSYALDSDDGVFKHMMSTSTDYPLLSNAEMERMKGHSSLVAACCESIKAFNDERLNQVNMGAQLTQLRTALINGGANGKVKEEKGLETDSGRAANEGISAFYEFWMNLGESQQDYYLRQNPSLYELLNRLFRPDHADYIDSTYCVELIARGLKDVIEEINRHNQSLKTRKEQALTALGSAIGEKLCQLSRFNRLGSAPKVMQQVFARPLDEFTLFSRELLIDYLVQKFPCSLPEYADVIAGDLAEKNRITTKRFSNSNTALMLAAKDGSLDAVRILHTWGANLDALNDNFTSALSFAARHGHADVVRYLLSQGAGCELTINNHSNTPLLEAINHNQSEIVDALLTHGIDLNTSRIFSLSTTQTPHNNYLPLLDKVLAQAILLPLYQQQTLLTTNGSKDLTILQYISQHRLPRLTPIIEILRQQPQALLRERLSPLLHSAIGLNNKNYCNALLSLHADPDILDSENTPPLHKVISKGYMPILIQLLEHHANTEAMDSSGRAAIHLAIDMRKTNPRALAELLRRGISIQTRVNGTGANAVDLAIAAADQELVKTLLYKAVLLPLAEQTETLSHVDNGIHVTVNQYAYAKQLPYFADLFFNQSKPDQSESSDLNAYIEIDRHIHQFEAMIVRLQKKYGNTHPTIPVATTLIYSLLNAKANFIISKEPTLRKIVTFRSQCLDAVNAASPVLNQHREWGKLIVKFLLGLLTLPVSLPLYTVGLFSIKTKSAQQLDVFKHDLEEIPVAQP